MRENCTISSIKLVPCQFLSAELYNAVSIRGKIQVVNKEMTRDGA